MKISRMLAAVALSLGLISCVFAQTDEARSKRSTEIMNKFRQVDILNQLLPILLKKEQIKKMLPVIEKVRAEVKKAEKDEYEFLKKLEPTLEKSIKGGVESNQVPKIEDLRTIFKSMQSLSLHRQVIAEENAELLYAVVDKELNAGQKKAMANALRVTQLDPGIDPTKVDEKYKIKFFTKFVLLDPAAYELLLKLSS